MILPFKAPFPHFGGKSKIAPVIWSLLGNPDTYIEPFGGSLAVLLARPDYTGQLEIANELDPYISNAYRAIKQDPLAVAEYAAWPIHEIDLHARHAFLQRQHDFKERMRQDPEYFDPKLAGWWLWGRGASIGGGWAKPKLNSIPQLQGGGIHSRGRRERLPELFSELSARLRFVRITCGDWTRVVKPSVFRLNSLTGVLLDPPYITSSDLYTDQETNVAAEVVEWCKENWNNPTLRIVYCGYEGDLKLPSNWSSIPWQANGGLGNMAKKGTNLNKHRERIYYNPTCVQAYSHLSQFSDRKAA